jgi:hypothetical protein
MGLLVSAQPSEAFPLTSSVNLGSGWKWSSWFGFFADTANPWIYHNEHGWMLATGANENDCWLWAKDMGWLWTAKNTYPNMYRSLDQAWLYYSVGTKNSRWFYNHGKARWEAPDVPPNFTGWWRVTPPPGVTNPGIIRLDQTGSLLTIEKSTAVVGVVEGNTFAFEVPGQGHVRGRLLSGAMYVDFTVPPFDGYPSSGTFTAVRHTGVVYEVWGGNTPPPTGTANPYANYVVRNYQKLGEASATATFSGSYGYYFVLAVTDVQLDAIQGSTGEYWVESMRLDSFRDQAPGTLEPLYGPPNSWVLNIGRASGRSAYRGSFGLKNRENWTGITIHVVP